MAQPLYARYVALDLEATSPDPATAEILEIAAVDLEGRRFHRYVATREPLGPDHEAFRLTGIPFGEYEAEKVPLGQALAELLAFLNGRPLLGHNLLRYDLPLLERALKEVGLKPPEAFQDALDTLRLAQLLFPTPPEGLAGYRLGDLYAYFSWVPLEGAHRAPVDAEATWTVLAGLQAQTPPPEVAGAWRALGLLEGQLYPALEPEEARERLFRVRARVDLLDQEGRPFPPPEALGPDLLPRRRPAQEEMFRRVGQALGEGRRVLLEAPTGTGKTKGYLYPALHLGEPVWVATHTKVLQRQALEELSQVAAQGYGVTATLVKSPRDTLCLEALQDLFLDLAEEVARDPGGVDEGLRAAVGLLVHYARLGGHDLEALPGYWHHQRGFREARALVGTNPHRCREGCPFFHFCAYQQLLEHRQKAKVLITNQAYLLAHFLRETPPSGRDGEEAPPGERPHLVVDEAHHLEDVATEALTQVLDQEELTHLLNRLAHPDPERERGLLRHRRRLEGLPEEARKKVRDLDKDLLPQVRQALKDYSELLVDLIKNRGRGDPRYGYRLELGPRWARLEAWPRVKGAEDRLLQGLEDLRRGLREAGIPPGSLLFRELQPVLEELNKALDLLWERRKVLGLAREAPDTNLVHLLVHLSEWDPLTDGWRHLAQPVEVAPMLEGLWPRFGGVVLTSATLSVATEQDLEGFDLLRRTLGLEGAEGVRLPPSLPYEKAHLLIPRHLPEAREGTLPRFQRFLHEELRSLLPRVHRSLTLFTSLRRMQEAKEALDDLPHLLVPLTRREREDVASLVRQNPALPVAALGSRSYMEGVDFPALNLVGLERLPFPVPSALLSRRMARLQERGLDPWWGYYLPKAALTFVQAFGRLIRDSRADVGDGAFVLWDKKLLNAAYQALFLQALPPGVHHHHPEDRRAFYGLLADILGLDRASLPREELEEETVLLLRRILDEDLPLEAKARRIAEKVFGLRLDPERWRKQWEAMALALEGKDLLALLPTGFGKSLAFQIPALLEGARGGLTLVVSPLVALMKDQADRLLEMGLPVGAVHSLMSASEQRGVLQEVRAGRVWLLYVSPERLNRSEELRRLLWEKHREGKLRRVVFDEAHCLVEWGFDFRPDYLKALERLAEFPGVPKSFFTATLTPKDQRRLEEAVGLKDHGRVYPETFHRPNLRFAVNKVQGEVGKFQRLVQALSWLLERGGSGVVYVSTRSEAERLAWALERLFPELGVEAYHAGLGPLPRREAQERFMEGSTRIMVATTAFGMGVDKPDIRLVVHWRPPLSLEEYIQQAGRAGRDGEEAYALLLFTQGDWSFLRWMAGLGRDVYAPFAHRLIRLLEEEGALRGYREGIYDRLHENKPPSEEEEAEEEALEEEDEEADEEPPRTFQRELGRDNLERLLASLERAGVLEYTYLPGKALLQARKEVLEARLTLEERKWLQKAGYRDGVQGSLLNFAQLPPEEAQHLDERLYGLAHGEEGVLYHYREPLLFLRAGERLFGGYLEWAEEQERLREGARKRLEEVRRYAERSSCRARLLLRHLGEKAEPCGACDACALDKGPWQAYPVDLEELERAYSPLDLLLEFFALEEQKGATPTPYLGRRSTLAALRGKDRVGQSPLGKRYLHHPLFGHLAFFKPKKLEETFDQALRRGYLEEKGRYQGQPLYGLTQKGWERYRRRLRKEEAHV